jgi:hypothetical protein
MLAAKIGHSIWGSSVAVLEFLTSPVVIYHEQRDAILTIVVTQPLLELGTGTGVTGIDMALLGVPSVNCIDVSALVHRIKRNAALNASKLIAQPLDRTLLETR